MEIVYPICVFFFYNKIYQYCRNFAINIVTVLCSQIMIPVISIYRYFYINLFKEDCAETHILLSFIFIFFIFKSFNATTIGMCPLTGAQLG